MDFAKELLGLVEKAKKEGVSIEDMVNTLEETMEDLQEELEDESEKENDS